jgi:hypothetical protein
LVIHQENDYLNNSTAHSQEIYNTVSRIINTSDYITRQVQTINPLDKKSITVLNGIKGWVACFSDLKLKGYLEAGGLNDPNDIQNHKDLLEQAYNMGKNI